jgi:hypothetical protein
MVDFSKLASTPMDEVRRPPSAPAGTYYGVVTGIKFADSRFDNKETGQKDGVLQIMLRPTEYLDDVLPEGFSLSGKLFTREEPVIDCHGQALQGQFYVKQLLEALGIATSGRSFSEAVADLAGSHVMFDLTARADKQNPEVIYNDVRKLRARQS